MEMVQTALANIHKGKKYVPFSLSFVLAEMYTTTLSHVETVMPYGWEIWTNGRGLDPQELCLTTNLTGMTPKKQLLPLTPPFLSHSTSLPGGGVAEHTRSCTTIKLH